MEQQREQRPNNLSTNIQSTIAFGLKILALIAISFVIIKINLGVALLFGALFTLLYLFFNRRKSAAYFAPNIVFIPLVFLVLNDPALLGSPLSFDHALGQLVVAFWMTGIVYIFLGSFIRFITIGKLRRGFPPFLTGSLMIVISVFFFLIIIFTGIFQPLYQGSAIHYVPLLGGVVAFTVTGIIRRKTARSHPLHWAYPFYGLLSGALFVGLIELIMIGFKFPISETYMLVNFTNNATLDWHNIFTIFDLAKTFNFLNHIDFSWPLFIRIIPLAIIIFMQMFEAVGRKERLIIQDKLTYQDIDRLLFANGVSMMIGSTIGLAPNMAYNHYDDVMRDKNKVKTLAFGLIILLIFGVFTPLTNIFLAIPYEVYFGALAFQFYLSFRHGAEMIMISHFDNPSIKNTIIVTYVIFVGVVFSIFELFNYATGLNILTLQIGTIKIDGVLLAVIGGLILNVALPRKALNRLMAKNKTISQ